MGPGSDFWRVFVVRVLLSRPDLRLCAARLRCLACVDGPVLDRVHVFLHVRPRFERVVSGNHNLDPLFLSGGGTLEHAPLDSLEQSVSSGSAAVIGRYRESSCSL